MPLPLTHELMTHHTGGVGSMRFYLVALLFTIACQAEIQSRAVAYEHEGTSLSGHLAWDDSVVGMRPGILVVHEWWGLNDYARERAEQLAAQGYVAFALDMYGADQEGKRKVSAHPADARTWVGDAGPRSAVRSGESGSNRLLLRWVDCHATGLFRGRAQRRGQLSWLAAVAQRPGCCLNQGECAGLPRRSRPDGFDGDSPGVRSRACGQQGRLTAVYL